MYRLGVCDRLVFFDAGTSRWYCGASFKNPSNNNGISAAPDGSGIVFKSEPPLCGWEPNWVGRDGVWGTCADDMFLSPKQAWGILCARAQRRKVEEITSVTDAFCITSLL